MDPSAGSGCSAVHDDPVEPSRRSPCHAVTCLNKMKVPRQSRYVCKCFFPNLPIDFLSHSSLQYYRVKSFFGNFFIPPLALLNLVVSAQPNDKEDLVAALLRYEAVNGCTFHFIYYSLLAKPTASPWVDASIITDVFEVP